MSRSIFTQQVLEKTKPIDEAIHTIKRLSQNYDIYIITARPQEMLKWVTNWLNKFQIDNNINQIISSSGKEKQKICLENNIFCLCDDDFRHVREKKIDMRILFNSNKMRNNYKNIKVVNSWKDIEKLFI